MSGRKILYFAKVFEKKEYAEEFLNGNLFINRLSYFRQIEDHSENNRSDNKEAVVGWHQPQNISMKLNEHVFSTEDFAAPISIQLHDHGHLHVFCLFAGHSGGLDIENLTEEQLPELKKLLQLSEECSELGDYVIMINKSSQFIQRVSNAIEKANYGMQGKLVDYYDPDIFSGFFTEEEAVFKKRKNFEHQKEYRFVIATGDKGASPLRLDIGDIRDIAEICDINTLQEGLTVELKKADPNMNN